LRGCGRSQQGKASSRLATLLWKAYENVIVRVPLMDKFIQTAQNVVEMSKFQSDTGFAPIAQIESYWEALRGTRLMPKRSEIDPRGIEQALEFAFIVERIAPGIARLRIAGSHLSDIMGMEVRGMPLTSFITPSFRRQVSDTLEEVFETPAMCELHLKSEAGQGARPQLDARMLLLPLKSDLGDVSRILGCLVSNGELGHAPRRFDVTRSDMRPILASKGAVSIKTETAPVVPPAAKLDMPSAQDLTKGFAEAPQPFETKSGKRLPPYLRLVKSDD